MSIARLFSRIVQIAPAFEDVVIAHERDNDAQLPHLLMADLLRFIGTRLEGDVLDQRKEVLGILELLEMELETGTAETQSVIAISFLEHLESESFFSKLYSLLGPRLRAEHAPFAWRSANLNAR